MKHPACPVFLLLLAHATAFSQTVRLSLDQAVDTALTRNGNIRFAELGVRQSGSRVNELKSMRLPSLLLNSHYLHTPEAGYNEVVTNGGEYGLQLSASVPVVDGGARNALIDQSINMEEQSTITLEKNKRDVTFAVRSVYYGILQFQEEVRIRREIVERLEDYLKLLRQLRLGGTATESDVLKAQVDLNNARIALESAQQEVRKSTLALKNVAGIPFDRDVETVPLSDSGESAPVPEFSIETNPDVQLTERSRRSAEFDISAARAERFPTLTVSGDAGALGVTPREFSSDLGYSILLSLDLPLFDWGAINRRIEQKEFARDQFDIQLQLQKREIETEWRSTLGDIDLQKRNLVNYSQNIGEADRNYLSAKSRFAGGSGSNLEVLEAQRLLGEVKLNYNSTLFQLRLDFATALRLSGKQ